MIAVDTNILVYAHREDSDWHGTAYPCIESLAKGKSAWAIPWPCVHEFLSIVTHPRIYDPPTPLSAALKQIDAWIEAPGLVLLSESGAYWPELRAPSRPARLREAASMTPALPRSAGFTVCANCGPPTETSAGFQLSSSATLWLTARDTRGRKSPRPLRDPLRDRSGEDGGSLPCARHAAGADRRGQGPAGAPLEEMRSGSASSGKRRRSPRSPIPTSARSTTWATRKASST